MGEEAQTSILAELKLLPPAQPVVSINVRVDIPNLRLLNLRGSRADGTLIDSAAHGPQQGRPDGGKGRRHDDELAEHDHPIVPQEDSGPRSPASKEHPLADWESREPSAIGRPAPVLFS